MFPLGKLGGKCMLQWILYWRKEQKMLKEQMRNLKYNQRQRTQVKDYRAYKNRWMTVKSL